MQVTREDLSPVTVKLSVKCEPDEVKKGFDKAYRQAAKSVRIPGFRPGAAPKAMVEKAIANEDLVAQAADNIVTDLYKKALDSQELKPFTTPHVDLTKIEKEPPSCEFTVTVGLEPVVKLGNYLGLSINRPPIAVTMDDINEQLAIEQRNRAKRSEVSGRGIEVGDYTVINLQPSQDERLEGKTFMVVVGKTFEGLDEALLGMELEQVKELDLEFPDSFDEKDWAGKKLHVTLSVRSITAMSLPELDDDFARAYAAEDIEDLKARIERALLGARQEAAREYLIDQIFEQIEASSEVEVSDAMWEPVAAQRLEEDRKEQKKKGKSLEVFAAENGMTVEKLIETRKAEARANVVRAVIVQEILKSENLEISNENFNNEALFMARDYQVEPNTLVAEINKNENLQQELRLRTAFRVASDYLISKANITELTPTA